MVNAGNVPWHALPALLCVRAPNSVVAFLIPSAGFGSDFRRDLLHVLGQSSYSLYNRNDPPSHMGTAASSPAGHNSSGGSKEGAVDQQPQDDSGPWELNLSIPFGAFTEVRPLADGTACT